VGCQAQRWDANRSGGIPTTLCDHFLCFLKFVLSYSVQQESCVIQVLYGGVPTVVVGFQPLVLLVTAVFIWSLTANALSVEWDAKQAPATDITSWLVGTTLHIPFLHVSVKYEIIFDLFQEMIEVYK